MSVTGESFYPGRIRPLYWPDMWVRRSRLQRFLVGMPFIGIDRRTRRHICWQLAQRSFGVCSYWNADDRSWKLIKEVSDLIQDCLRWPNEHYLPDDPCEILLWEPSCVSELLAEEVMLRLSEDFKLPETVWDRFGELCFGQLIEAIPGHTWKMMCPKA